MRLQGAVLDKVRATTAVATAVVLVFGLLGALRLDPDQGSLQVRTAAPPPTAPSEPDPVEDTTTTTAAAPPPTAAPASPPAKSTAGAKPRPAATAPRPAGPAGGVNGYRGPRSPGTVSFKYEPGRTSWSGTSNGVQMAVSIDKATPRAGEALVFTLTVGSETHPCCGFHLAPGDGGQWSKDTGFGCPGGPPGPATKTTQTTHVYNKAGRWEFYLAGTTGNCQTTGTPIGHMYGWIDVLPGTSSSQGPQQPTIAVDRYGPAPHWDEPGYVTVYGRARDEDGYIARLVVDYGDGTTEQYPGDGAGCRPTSSGWPAASMAWTPTNPPPTHKYAEPGTYKVTVTAYSQGCDGRDIQSVSGSFEHAYVR